jgi:hypothetical protein
MMVLQTIALPLGYGSVAGGNEYRSARAPRKSHAVLRGGRSRIVIHPLHAATIQYVENTQKDWP